MLLSEARVAAACMPVEPVLWSYNRSIGGPRYFWVRPMYMGDLTRVIDMPREDAARVRRQARELGQHGYVQMRLWLAWEDNAPSVYFLDVVCPSPRADLTPLALDLKGCHVICFRSTGAWVYATHMPPSCMRQFFPLLNWPPEDRQDVCDALDKARNNARVYSFLTDRAAATALVGLSE